MLAFKATESNMTCRGFRYEIGKTYVLDEHTEGPQRMCGPGFHACLEVHEIWGHYKGGRVFVVKLGGNIIEQEGKVCASEITFVRELERSEYTDVIEYFCHGGNKGYRNRGYGNTGKYNRGDQNTGNQNTGHGNKGDENAGHSNEGNGNKGNFNTGDSNSGSYNIGNHNKGHCNKGDLNAGDSNTGNHNTGDYNKGNYNTGDYNICYRSPFIGYTYEASIPALNGSLEVAQDSPEHEDVLLLCGFPESDVFYDKVKSIPGCKPRKLAAWRKAYIAKLKEFNNV